MNGALANLATRYAGRPVLMLPRAAYEVAQQLHTLDSRAFERPGRLGAIFRALRGKEARQTLAMEDDDAPSVPFGTRAAYTPLYVGEVDDIGFCWSLKDGVALMEVSGPLLETHEVFCGTVYHGYDSILAGLKEAAADDRVRAIFIKAATPGGVVAGGLAELSAWIRENRAAAGGKPIHVYASMACSAGYWAFAPGDRIIAPKVGLVGSIGTVLVHENYGPALEKFGLEVTAIQFGAKKTDGAWWEALSPAAKADLQAEIDQCGRDFVADVHLSRPQLTPEALIATEAGVFMGQHDEDARSGLALGFVDEISGEEAAFAALAASVSDPQSTGMPSIAARGGRAASKPEKDKPMADTAPNKSGGATALAQAEATLRRAQAAVDRLKADAEAEPAADPAEEGDPPAEGDDGAPPKEPTAAEGGEGEAEAEKIAASAEAKANPNLALAAIASGQTFSQFKANAAAAGPAPKGALREALAGSRRLGADSPSPSAAKIDPKAVYAARRAGRRG